MAYSIIISPRAQREVENAIDYYALYSTKAPVNFISALKEAYADLETNPFFGERYKNVHALKIKRFPYLLYFTINEKRNVVRVLACFHSRRNPDKRPGH